jgi:LemA protein
MAVSLIVVLVVLAAGLLWFVALYNRFIRGKNLMLEAWSGIDVQLKRRHDLIPNLLETVKGYMQYERAVLQEITDLRSRSISATSVREKGEAENALSQTLRSLFAVAEAYPDLKANQNFLDLQKNLTDIEEQIQLARRYYNGTVRDFNIMVEAFPSALVASGFGFKLAEYFEIEATAEREVPSVKF